MKTARAARRSSSREVGALQRWFQAAIMHPGGAAGASADRRVRALLPRSRAKAALAAQLEPSRQMTELERLDVYASSYFLRLRDILKVDYPAVLRELGEDAFERTIREFVTRHPSTSFTLNDLGARFPRFLASARTKEVAARRSFRAFRVFLVELATLERATEEVFHERLVPAADVAKLRSIPVERWNDARFTLNPATRLLEFDHAVDRHLQAVLEGRKPPPLSRTPSWVLVYRKGWKAWRARLVRDQFRILAELASGRTLGAALARTLRRKDSDGERTLQHVGEWFHEWTAEGIFAAIEVGPVRGAPRQR